MKIISQQINYDENFPHLNNAPSVEAVIDFQVVSIPSWDHAKLKKQLESRLPSYPKIEEVREIQYTLGAPSEGKASPKDLGCIGLRAISTDDLYITQFNRDRFALSRIKKYNDWVSFCKEANNLWDLYRELLQPTKIKRIGVRFINRMIADYKSKDFLHVFQDAPKSKQISDWDLESFLHRDVLQIPNTNYRINLLKTVVSSPTKQNEVAAILDSDVFYNQETPCEWDSIAEHLKAIHWIKNKVFFKSITKKKIEEYK